MACCVASAGPERGRGWGVSLIERLHRDPEQMVLVRNLRKDRSEGGRQAGPKETTGCRTSEVAPPGLGQSDHSSFNACKLGQVTPALWALRHHQTDEMTIRNETLITGRFKIGGPGTLPALQFMFGDVIAWTFIRRTRGEFFPGVLMDTACTAIQVLQITAHSVQALDSARFQQLAHWCTLELPQTEPLLAIPSHVASPRIGKAVEG
jgi:hypothetical protein